MDKPLSAYKAVIFDVDGTLYFQPPLRLFMARRLLFYYLRHPGALKELRILSCYRKVRENWERPGVRGESLKRAQMEKTALLTGTSRSQVERVIRRWIEEEPLTALRSYRDDKLAEMIAGLRERGVTVVAYSDYPAGDKLEAMGIGVDDVFCSEDEEIGSMKPDPKGLRFILEQLGLTPEEALMVGDRWEKDGEAAKAAGMDCFILKRGKRSRLAELHTEGWL